MAAGGGEAGSGPGGLDDARDRYVELLEAGDFLAEPATPRCGDRVVPGPASCGRFAPLRRHPPLALEPFEGRIERTLLHPEDVGRLLFDVAGDGVAVQGGDRQRLENQ